jgi:dUTP pyrophosphatase
MDLCCACENDMPINAGATVAVPTGLVMAIPPGFEGQIRPRSGLAFEHNIGIINSPGTIDSDYRGEVMVLLTNFSSEPYSIKRGDRIAQLVISRCERATIELVSELSQTERGHGGFGHSGR